MLLQQISTCLPQQGSYKENLENWESESIFFKNHGKPGSLGIFNNFHQSQGKVREIVFCQAHSQLIFSLW